MASTKSCTDDIDSSSTPETDTSAPQPVPRDDFLNIAPWRNQSAMEEGWRNQAMIEDAGRVLFYMGDDDAHKLSATQELAGVDDIGDRKIVVGICAMSKKSGSKPMLEILARLERFEYLQIIVFEEETILDSSVEDWPICDVFISFFSAGFPLAKAIEYKNLRKPFVINDLEAQYLLMDRREVYKILVREGIAHPRYAVMNRGLDGEPVEVFEENEDAVEINGIVFQRPFVEKPVCADDHNVYIYFPVSAGGGCQRLFRKVGSRSSVYSPCSRVRKTGSYIYEDFMPTDGTDVKVYTVGPDYAHAEARKSPALDGKVERDKDGKEIRYPVVLSVGEKLLARKVCLAFQQNVCGFDLLRTSGKSYVCDVNGFSFVKNSTKYYDDCANVLGTMIVRALAPQLHIPLVLGAAPEDIPVVPTTSGSMMELRCVVAVIRHGDRTPKQKMKMEVKHKKFFTLFEKYDGYKKGHLKLKKPKQLQEVLDIARDLLQERNLDSNPEVQEKKAKLRQLKLVLEMYGHFSGINRKVQLKYQPNGAPKRSSSEEDEVPREPSLVLIVKWGGELTPAGKYQAEDLGKAFRTLYPGGRGEFETPGLGFLRLHSTFRHDLKIYASDEGRVQMTAAAFTKGLLALEGELTPILVAMVKSANTNGLLDKEGETSKYRHIVKEKLLELLNQDKEFDNEDIQKLVPTGGVSLMNAVKFIKNPKKLCDQIFQMLQEIVARIKTLKMKLKSRDLKLYHNESWELLIRRWAKLEKDFKLKTGMYDISKIPDIYDCIKYELQHNQKTLQFTRAEELFRCSKAMADIVIPQEYGITVEEKLHISQSICTPLMRKIHNDLLQCCQGMDSPNPDDEEYTRLNVKYTKGVSTPERFVRTRLYFTSESHIHSLLNMFHYGGLCDDVTDEQWKKAMDFLGNTPELNYMTQINIMMFEDPTKDWQSPEKFHVELHFSPGAYTSFEKNVMGNSGSGYRPTLSRLGGAGSMPDFLAGKSTLEPSVPTNIITEETKAAALSKSIKEEPLTEENEMTSSGSPSVENMDNNIVEKSAEDGENVTDKSIKDDGNLTKSIDDGENMTDKSNDGGNMTGKSIKDSEPSDVGKLDLENSAEVAVDKSVDELGIHVDKLSVIDKSTVTTGMPIEMADSSLDGKSGVVAGKPDFSPDNNAADMTKLISTDVTGNVSPAVDIPDSNIGDSSPMNDTDDGDLSRTPTIHSTDIDMGASDVADNDALDGNKGNTDEGNSENSDKGKIEHKGNAKPADVGNTEDVGNSEIKNTEDVGNSEIKNTKDTGNTGNIASSNIKNIGEGKRERKKFFVNLAVNPVVDFSSSESNKPQKSQQSLGIRDDVSGNEINKDGGSTAIDQLDFADVFDLGEADIGDLGDITDSSDSDAQESTTLTSVQGLQGKTSSSGGNVPQPKSPDPLIPEWDWDDGHDNKPTNVEDKTDTIQSESRSLAQRQRSVSLSDPNFSTSLQLAPDSPSAVSLPKPIEDCRRNSFGEEKRSRSLEDQEPRSGIALIEKHYLTIHLPINKDCHLNAFSNLIYFNPDAFKDPSLVTLGASPSPHGQPMTPRCPKLAGSCSTPNLFGSESAGHDLHFAFDGFNMVPSLKPLETLHNALTMQDMDDFLTRATTTKFFTPASSPMYGSTTGVVSPIYQEQVVRVKSTQSLPSSCNSSGGPSSPTSASTPVDFMNKLKKYILDSQKRMQENDGDVDPNTANQQSTQSTQSTNQQQPGSSNQNAQTSTNKNSSSYPVVKLSNQKGASLVSRSNPANKQSPAVTSPLIGQKQNGGSKLQVNSKNSSTTQQDIEQDGNNKQQTSIKNSATTQDVKTNSNKLSTNLDKGGNPAQTSVSRSVARPSNPRSPVFHVTHVPEESLLKNVTTPQDMTTTSTVTEQKATPLTSHDTSKVPSNDKGN